MADGESTLGIVKKRFGFLLLWLITQRGRRRREMLTGADAVQLRAIRWFGWFYSASFIYAWSGVSYNLGLISRQRTHVWMPLLLVLATSLASTRRQTQLPSRTNLSAHSRWAA